MVLMYLKTVSISSVGPRILIPKMKKYHLRLRTVHACSWGRSVKVFCTINLWAMEPKAARPVIKLQFLVWIKRAVLPLVISAGISHCLLPSVGRRKPWDSWQDPVWVRATDSSVMGCSRSGPIQDPSSHAG